MDRLQYITRRGVVNRHPFGTDIKRFLKKKDVFSLIYEQGCGWLDGGCATLASAFVRWIGTDAEAWCFYSLPEKIPQHVICRLGKQGLYLDGDGLGTEEDIIQKLIQLEGLQEPLVLEAFDFTNGVLDESSIHYSVPGHPCCMTLWNDIAQVVAEKLYRRFGAWWSIRDLFLPVP